MTLLWHDIRKNPLLWLLVFVPAVLAAEHLFHGQVLFIMAVLAIILLAALLSHRSAWFLGVLVIAVYLTFARTLYLLPPRES